MAVSMISLPLPRIRSDVLSVEQAQAYRRSHRSFKDEPLSINDISQILWAAYGLSMPIKGFLTCPSAGATYPLELYLVVGTEDVKLSDGEFLEPGSYRYLPQYHVLAYVKPGHIKEEIYRACLSQKWVLQARANIVIAADYERTTRYYGERGIRYVILEAGHCAQNIYLEAAALGLGAVAIGAFYDEELGEAVGLREEVQPIYMVSVGIPRHRYYVSEEELHEHIRRNRRRKGLV